MMVEQVRAVEHGEALATATTMAPSVTTAPASSEPSVIAMLTLAFGADPAVRWLYPDPQQYLTCWPAFVRAFGGRAFAHGTAYHTEGFAGAALWLPPDVRPDEDAIVDLLAHSVAEDAQADLFAVLEQMDACHPSEPHWYLPLIGVDPTRQGRGLGAALLRHTLAACDRDRMPVCLESSNARNIPLYERHGFAVVGTIQAGSSPPLYPMVRTPRPVQ